MKLLNGSTKSIQPLTLVKPTSACTIGPLQAGPPCCVPEPLIEISELCLRYGRNLVLEDIALRINRGCVTSLIGPSGCGKTSFLTCINRLTDVVPTCCVSGKVRLGSLDVLSPDTDVLRLRRRIGMIFQKPNPFPLSIRRNMEFPLREHGVREREKLEEVVERALKDVGLWDEVKDRLERPAMSLSGGQQQRLCIARALALQPEVLLLDEPCSALDSISTGVIENLILSFSNRLTVVVVTHDLSQARRIADYTAFFWAKNGVGKLIEHGPSQQMFETPQDELTDAFINGRVVN